MKSWRYIYLMILFLWAGYVQAQSFAYKALLDITYDKGFPLVYLHQEEVLESALFLDTREKREFDVSHIQGARWVGYETFDVQSLNEIGKDQVIVVYCSIGARSEEIGKKLQKAGYKYVFNLYGGLFHWVNEGLPVYANGQQTKKVHAYNRAWGIWLTNGEKVY